MKFRAVNDSVIVEVPKVERTTRRDSGLILVEDDKSTKTTVVATVVSVGEGKFDYKTGSFVPPPVKVGDKIVMALATGIALDDTHRMVKTDDIFAVVE